MTNSCNIHVLIPCRLDSTRLPNKPLIQVAGKPSIRWVVEAAEKSGYPYTLLTDSWDIVDAARPQAHKIINSCCINGTERCSIGAENINANYFIIVAGDELLTQGSHIQRFERMQQYPVSTLVALNPIYSFVTVAGKRIINIGRLPNYNETIQYEGLGVYGYQRDTLLQYKTLPILYKEQTDGIELLRMIEWGYEVGYDIIEDRLGHSLNNKEDVALLSDCLSVE